jgi:thermostable 8-oxoguanine DNA glycosylase
VIDPQKLVDLDLEEFLLFALLVANKPAGLTARKLDVLLSTVQSGSPLHRVAAMEKAGVLEQNLRAVGTGQYTRILAAIRYLIHRMPRLDLRTCTIEDLERVPGIGPKTARFFLLHSREGMRCAALDTHLLKFLRDSGVEDVPVSTPPSGATYRRLEEVFLKICDQVGSDPATLDLAIWNTYSKGGTGRSVVLTGA